MIEGKFRYRLIVALRNTTGTVPTSKATAATTIHITTWIWKWRSRMSTMQRSRPRKRAKLEHHGAKEEFPQPTEELQDVFRKYFEAQFKPLDNRIKVQPKKEQVNLASLEDDHDESEWSGFSETEGRFSNGSKWHYIRR